MAKPEWGIKRVCQSCSTLFYDFDKSPIICPSCGSAFDPEAVLKSRRNRAPTPEEAKPARPKPKNEDDPDLENEDEDEDEDEDDEILPEIDDEDPVAVLTSGGDDAEDTEDESALEKNPATATEDDEET